MANSLECSVIPRYCILRRVPTRYQRVLPLNLMKQYQCIVVGAAQGTLTVAITGEEQVAVIESIKRLTGRTIFPVLIDPPHMQMLIQRIERCEQRRAREGLGSIYYLHRFQAYAMITFLLTREEKRLREHV